MLSFTQWTMSFHTVNLYCHILFKNNFFAFCFFYDEQWKKAYVCLKVTCLYHGWWVFIHDFEFPSICMLHIFMWKNSSWNSLNSLFHGITIIFLIKYWFQIASARPFSRYLDTTDFYTRIFFFTAERWHWKSSFKPLRLFSTLVCCKKIPELPVC